jgi:hypothetical protein
MGLPKNFFLFLANLQSTSKYVVRKHLCDDDSPIYTSTVHYVVRASTLLPRSGPLSQSAIAVLVCV